MKKYFVLLLAMTLIIFAQAECVYGKNNTADNKSKQSEASSATTIFTTEMTDSSSSWPAINHGYAYYQPSTLDSEEEAISNIRSCQGFVYISGHKPYDITVDKYTAVFKIEWTENTSYQEEVPTTGGFFIGWDYIPTYSNTVQTYHQSEQKHDSMTITFKDINAIFFYRNSLCISTSGVVNTISSDSPARLKSLADAIYTLTAKNGGTSGGDMLCQMVHLSDEQCRKLKIEDGDMVTAVFEHSESDKAGIKEGDVILNLKEISEAGGFRKFFSTGKSMKILRWEQKGSIINYKNIQIRLKGVK
jgi:hypothetical protein